MKEDIYRNILRARKSADKLCNTNSHHTVENTQEMTKCCSNKEEPSHLGAKKGVLEDTVYFKGLENIFSPMSNRNLT